MCFLVWFLLVQGEVCFAGFPGFGDFDEDAGDEPQERFLTREEADDAGALLDLAVDVLAGVGCGMNRGDRLQTDRGHGLHIDWGLCPGKMSYQWNRNNDLLIWRKAVGLR